MNTRDPNEKIVVPAVEADHEHAIEAADVSAPANGSSGEAAVPAHEVESHEADAAAQPQNLPKYHHHRSTALW